MPWRATGGSPGGSCPACHFAGRRSAALTTRFTRSPGGSVTAIEPSASKSLTMASILGLTSAGRAMIRPPSSRSCPRRDSRNNSTACRSTSLSVYIQIPRAAAANPTASSPTRSDDTCAESSTATGNLRPRYHGIYRPRQHLRQRNTQACTPCRLSILTGRNVCSQESHAICRRNGPRRRVNAT